MTVLERIESDEYIGNRLFLLLFIFFVKSTILNTNNSDESIRDGSLFFLPFFLFFFVHSKYGRQY